METLGKETSEVNLIDAQMFSHAVRPVLEYCVYLRNGLCTATRLPVGEIPCPAPKEKRPGCLTTGENNDDMVSHHFEIIKDYRPTSEEVRRDVAQSKAVKSLEVALNGQTFRPKLITNQENQEA
ncbi:MAG TPA: hypothetical protein VMR41_02295 [Patescibacteria group bacterium]|nr:hypothetical protein [Patescibacteria group bacterium]